jgi:hypothetical protein
MRRLAWLLIALPMMLGACGREQPVPRKAHLAVLPPRIPRVGLTVGAEATRYGFVVDRPQDETQQVVVDGVAGPVFPKCGPPTFGPMSKRFFYWALERRHDMGSVALVADHRVVASGFGRPGSLVFSEDGSRWAAVAGTPQRHDSGTVESGPVVVLADDRELGRYPDASLPSFSPRGELAYLVETEGGSMKLLVDGAERASYEKPETQCAIATKRQPVGPNLMPQFRTAYLSDGSLLVFAQERDGWVVYRDDTRLASYPASHGTTEGIAFGFGDPCLPVRAFAPSWVGFASEAPVAAWWERLEGIEERWRVVLNGKPLDERVCARFWHGHPPEVSKDGRRVAYACVPLGSQSDKPVSLVFDGKEFGPYEGLWGQAVSEDGRHVSYGASTGPGERAWSIYVDGKPVAGPFAAVWRPRLDVKSGHVAWQARPGGDEPDVLGVDGRTLASFDEVVWGPTFGPNGTVSWVIRRGRKVSRINLPTD